MTTTPPITIKAGAAYFALHGKWTYTVEQIQGSFVYYTVLETKQKCKTTVDDFADRVEPARQPYR